MELHQNMILNDKTIKQYLNNKKITITPLTTKKQIQPSSIDLRLGNTIQTFKETPTYIDTHKNITQHMKKQTIPENNKLIIQPHEFLLATTKEYIKLPNDIVGRVEGRSSIGRLGLTVHVTAGYIDPGFQGNITLEMYNMNKYPIAIYPNQRVCQLVLEELNEPAKYPYGCGECGSKYQGQTGATCSSISVDKF